MNFIRSVFSSDNNENYVIEDHYNNNNNNNNNNVSNNVVIVGENVMSDSKDSKEKFNRNELKKGEHKKLLIIDNNKNIKWQNYFNNKFLNEDVPVLVYQSGWEDIELTSYFYSQSKDKCCKCYVEIRDIYDNRRHTINPDFLLIRNIINEATPNRNWKNLLYGLMYANVPSVNNLQACYNFLERPLVFGELIKIREKYSFEEFPLISQNYYPNYQSMMIGIDAYPGVMKLGHAEAGMGKSIVKDHHDFEDYKSIVAMTPFYVTGEHFKEGLYDLRIQKIGDHYRVFKRYSISGNWKTNTGTSIAEDVELTDKYKFWIDEASKMYGGLDILAVDAIHTTDEFDNGQEYILEVNDCSIGLAPNYEHEDNLHIVELVLSKMEEIYYP
eukprot:TRINITY_DN4157_c0_g1_i1.p1 TRINITY_DN4157_c0_g1~~TRINITY_DN4157_c0_g1_i1.p1  ORF type:complete len:384 (-),score=103.56 TRINITY_DN4157_c0_g1_i1:24-1175(-)